MTVGVELLGLELWEDGTCMELLSDVQAVASILYHLGYARKVPPSAVQALDDIGM